MLERCQLSGILNYLFWFLAKGIVIRLCRKYVTYPSSAQDHHIQWLLDVGPMLGQWFFVWISVILIFNFPHMLRFCLRICPVQLLKYHFQSQCAGILRYTHLIFSLTLSSSAENSMLFLLFLFYFDYTGKQFSCLMNLTMATSLKHVGLMVCL